MNQLPQHIWNQVFENSKDKINYQWNYQMWSLSYKELEKELSKENKRMQDSGIPRIVVRGFQMVMPLLEDKALHGVTILAPIGITPEEAGYLMRQELRLEENEEIMLIDLIKAQPLVHEK